MFQLHPNAVHGDDDLQRSGALSIAVLDHADAECDDAVEDGLPHPNPAEEDDDNEVNLNDSNDNAGNDDEDDDTVTSEYEDEDTAAEGGGVFGEDSRADEEPSSTATTMPTSTYSVEDVPELHRAIIEDSMDVDWDIGSPRDFQVVTVNEGAFRDNTVIYLISKT